MTRYRGYCWVGLSASGLVLSSVYAAPVASVILFAVGLVALALIDLRAFLVLTFPVYGLAGAVVSLLVIENGSYITEQYRFGFNVGATGVLSLYGLAFLTLAHWIIVWRCGGSAARANQTKMSGRLLGRLVLLIGVGSGAAYGVVFLVWGSALSFTTRFEWAAQLPSIVGALHTMLRSYLIPVGFALAGMLLVVHGLRRSWPTLTLIFPMVALIGAGDKFSGFLLQCTMFLLGIGVAALIEGRSIRVRPLHLVIASVVILLLVSALVIGYLRTGADSAIQAINERIALQGHVWFGIFERFQGQPGATDLWTMVKNNTHDSPSGLDALSYLVSRPEFVYERIGRGVSFTMGGPATALSVFGTFGGFLVYALTGGLYAVVVVAMIRMRDSLAGFPTMILLILYIIVGYGTLMGYWDAFYGPVALACYVSLVVLYGVSLAIKARRQAKRGEKI